MKLNESAAGCGTISTLISKFRTDPKVVIPGGNLRTNELFCKRELSLKYKFVSAAAAARWMDGWMDGGGWCIEKIINNCYGPTWTS